MFWGAFGSKRTTDLAEVPTKCDLEAYQEILKSSLLPNAQRISGRRWIFQQDNASIHASKSTRKFFNAKHMRILPWPAKFPDLNPIENLWGILVRQVYAHGKQYDTINNLKQAIIHAWSNISPTIINNLIKSMKNRIYNTILKQGTYTK